MQCGEWIGRGGQNTCSCCYDQLKPELGKQDRREGTGNKRYPCREISNTW